MIDSIRNWVEQARPTQQEVGGLLLGRLEQGPRRASIAVESCEPMRISHRLGPEFTLTDAERDLLLKRFSEAREGGLCPVGFVRSDLRESLDLGEADKQLLQSVAGEAIYLLVRPGPDYTAACFSTSGGRIEQRLSTIPAPAFETWAVSQWITAIAACLLIALAGAGYYWQQSRTVEGPAGFGLNVQQTGKELRLTWNPRALHGQTILLVNDGAFERRIQLNREEIEHGSARYVPASNQVSFRLETAGVADSIWLVSSAAPPTQEIAERHEVHAAEVHAAKIAVVAPSNPDHRTPAPDRLTPTLMPAKLVTPRKVTRPEQSLAAGPMRILPAISRQDAPKLRALAPPKIASSAPPSPPTSAPIAVPEPFVTVSYTTSADAAAKHGIEKVPILRMLKHSRTVEPARSMGEIKPRVPGSLARQLSGESVISVEATVDKHGRVSNVEPLSSQADERLVRLVADAVNRTSFYPGQANGRDVSSKLVLTFRFRNSNATTASRVAIR